MKLPGGPRANARGEWTIRFKDGRPVAAEETLPDGSLLRRIEPVLSLRELCRSRGKSRRQAYRDLADGRLRSIGKFLGEWLLEAAEPAGRGVPESVGELFPEFKPADLKVRAHRDLILSRILSLGGRSRLRWAFSSYGEAGLRRFVANHGPRRLDARSLGFWALFFGLPRPRITQARAKGREWGGAGS